MSTYLVYEQSPGKVRSFETEAETAAEARAQVQFYAAKKHPGRPRRREVSRLPAAHPQPIIVPNGKDA